MLENKDIYKSRDVTTTEMVAIMMDLKYFDEQFMYYGCAYAKNGQIIYRIHDKVDRLYHFWRNSEDYNIYPTNITRFVRLLKVPSGKEREKAQLIEAEFVDKLKRTYPMLLFRALDDMGKTKNLNLSWSILDAWRERLEICYDTDQIELYHGAVQIAYDAKLLLKESYDVLIEWLKQRKELIDSCENVLCQDKKYFYGIAYWDDDKMNIYSNAEEYIVSEHRYNLMTQGIPCSYIFGKYYWIDSEPSLSNKKWRDRFEKDFSAALTQDNVHDLKALYSLPNAVNEEKYLNWQRKIENNIQDESIEVARSVMAYYKKRWLIV